MSKEKYISLKDAAKISGYSPDYVGQLIRRGKLPGKQVYLNVAWMTTAEAIEEYISNTKKAGDYGPRMTWKEEIASWIDFDTILKVVLGAAITVVLIFTLLLVYILSVSIDKHIDQGYQDHVQNV